MECLSYENIDDFSFTNNLGKFRSTVYAQAYTHKYLIKCQYIVKQIKDALAVDNKSSAVNC